MAKILVADDEPDLEDLITIRFRKEIQAGQYEFVFVSNGNEALEKLRLHRDIDLVLTDINMPEMDGLVLIGHLGQFDSSLKAVIISAYNDMENIRTAMNRGAFDFITKPINFNDLSITVAKAIKHVSEVQAADHAIKSYQLELEKRNQQLEQIAWKQSHGLRAPIARLLGLLEIVKLEKDPANALEVVSRLGELAHEVDTEIRDIVAQTNALDLPNTNTQ
jgi:YesN/AraC family two-component response regulator